MHESIFQVALTAPTRRCLVIAVLAVQACSDGTGPDRPSVHNQIVFAADRDGIGRQLYVMPAGGGPVERLAALSGAPSVPAVSPDGHWIAFVKGTGGGGVPDIYVMNAAGGEVVNVTSSPYTDGTPAWSPDGTELVFASTRFDQPGNVANTDLYRIRRDGTGEQRLTTDPADDVSPAWSPDGELIAFATSREGNYEIYTMAPDGSGQTNWSVDPAHDNAPAWSPDGSRLAFSSMRTLPRSIVIADRSGAGAMPLVTGNTASWSGDGTELVYDASGDIWRMAAGGGDPVNLTASVAIETSPVWAP